MKKNLLLLVTVFASLFILVGCGKSNALVGEWTGDTEDGLTTTFTFNDDGTAKYSNEYEFNSEGTYEIKEEVVTITMEFWDQPKEYTFKIEDGKLSLTANDVYSPNYKEMTKK